MPGAAAAMTAWAAAGGAGTVAETESFRPPPSPLTRDTWASTRRSGTSGR